MDRLGKIHTLKMSEMVQRTIDHACMILSSENSSPTEQVITEENEFDIRTWRQDVYDERVPSHFTTKTFVVLIHPIHDEYATIFISIDGGKPLKLGYGSLLMAAIDQRSLSGNLNNKDYWNAVQVDET